MYISFESYKTGSFYCMPDLALFSVVLRLCVRKCVQGLGDTLIVAGYP